MSEKEPIRKGLTVARDYARWWIGDAAWADQILRAYLNPEVVAGELQEELNVKLGN